MWKNIIENIRIHQKIDIRKNDLFFVISCVFAARNLVKFTANSALEYILRYHQKRENRYKFFLVPPKFEVKNNTKPILFNFITVQKRYLWMAQGVNPYYTSLTFESPKKSDFDNSGSNKLQFIALKIYFLKLFVWKWPFSTLDAKRWNKVKWTK